MIHRIFLLGHQARVGKDSLAAMMEERLPNCRRFAFADKLKDVVSDLYNFSDQEMYGNLKDVVDPRYGITPRKILQDFGQEQRARSKNIWAAYICLQIKDYIDRCGLQYSTSVITDFRFPNELGVVKEFFCNTAKVVPVKITRNDRDVISGSNDVSETALLDFVEWDSIFENNGTLEELYKRFDAVYSLNK